MFLLMIALKQRSLTLVDKRFFDDKKVHTFIRRLCNQARFLLLFVYLSPGKLNVLKQVLALIFSSVTHESKSLFLIYHFLCQYI